MEKSWRDEVTYQQNEIQPLWSMMVEAPETFARPAGFVRLKERHRIKAGSERWDLPNE